MAGNIELTMRQLQRLIAREAKRIFEGGKPLSLYIVGDPGIGKTAVISNASKKLGFEEFYAFHGSYREPTEFGLPWPDPGTGTFRMLPLNVLNYPAETKLCLFLDELPQSMPATQNAMAQLIHEHRCGDLVLPEMTLLIAAGNKATNRANTFNLGSHLKNRMKTIYVRCDPKEWVEDVANPRKYHSAVVSYIRSSPEMLTKIDTDSDAFPTPRSWSDVGDLLRVSEGQEVEGQDALIEQALIEGAVGSQAGKMFLGHLKVYRELRDPQVIFNNPTRCKVPEGEKSAQIMWAEITMLGRIVDKDTIDPAMQYIKRVPAEYQVICMHDILMRKGQDGKNVGKKIVFSNTRGADWLHENASLIGDVNSEE